MSVNEKYIIEVNNLTKDFGHDTGIFNIDLKIKKGEMIGFIGTNGSGKSTTIRSIIGFIKPTSGSSKVLGMDSWSKSSSFIKQIGYVPGEISFPDLPTGTSFLKSQANFLKLNDLSYANELIQLLQLDPSANLKRMSKGMKQKTALVAALMHNPPILILDEPTTGLDPLMRISFMNIVKKEHEKGKTIIMSSQSFEELEESCDKVIFILDGKIASFANMEDIKNRDTKDFKIEFNNKKDYFNFIKLDYLITRKQEKYNQVSININNSLLNNLMNDLNTFDVKFISEIRYTLETHLKKLINEKNEVKNNV